MKAPGIGEDREPADAFRQVSLRVVRQLVRENRLLLFPVERILENRVPEDDPPGRAEAVRVRVGLVGVLGDLLDVRPARPSSPSSLS